MKLETKITHTVTHKQILGHKQQFALKVLSMNEQQLQKEIEQALEENPLLEVNEEVYERLSSQDVYEQASAIITKEKSLTELLEEQLHFCNQAVPEALALYLIDSLDQNGYLKISMEQVRKLFPYDEDTIEDTIALLQTFEPVGIFARNLQECLLIQLCHGEVPYDPIAIRLVNEHLEDLAQSRWLKICNEMDISNEELKTAVSLIRSLSPKPASGDSQGAIASKPVARISVVDQQIQIQMLQNYSFLQINQQYSSLKDEVASAYIKKHTGDAQVFLDAIEKRQSTISMIISCIAQHQRQFFLSQGVLLPYTLKDIAEELHLHESTVSRAISQKVIEFEHRYLPMKTFFPAKLESGQSNSSTLDRIKDIIANENKKKPYSDQVIAKLLEKEGIQISRRTVTKYREQLKLQSAQQRKLL